VTDTKRKKGKGKAEEVIEDHLSQEENAQIAGGDVGLDAEDDFDELAENFEVSYNFRFEEP